MASRPIYQFYAELSDYKPKIWRRFQVADNVTVARFGYIVQVLFEMTASHLMAIDVPIFNDLTIRYDIPDEDYDDSDNPNSNIRVYDATRTKLYNAVRDPQSKLNLNYDFGDNWWVSLTLEKVFEDSNLSGKELPRALEGEGFGIIEDVGGTWGLKALADAFKRKSGERYEELRSWLGVNELDLTAFDIDDMNFRLKKIPRIYKQSYEDRLMPTQASIDLIERRYLKK